MSVIIDADEAHAATDPFPTVRLAHRVGEGSIASERKQDFSRKLPF